MSPSVHLPVFKDICVGGNKVNLMFVSKNWTGTLALMKKYDYISFSLSHLPEFCFAGAFAD